MRQVLVVFNRLQLAFHFLIFDYSISNDRWKTIHKESKANVWDKVYPQLDY